MRCFFREKCQKLPRSRFSTAEKFDLAHIVPLLYQSCRQDTIFYNDGALYRQVKIVFCDSYLNFLSHENATMTDTTIIFNTSGNEASNYRRWSIYKDLLQVQESANSSISEGGMGEKLFTQEFILELEEKITGWKKLAEEGCPQGQLQLGECYYFGEGVPKNATEAVKWFRKAAEQGNAEAQCRLGLCLDAGFGVQLNKEEAVKWYRRAAEQGHTDAMHLLGGSYYYGWGVPKNKKKALMWLQKARELGHESAVILLQQMGALREQLFDN